MKRAECHPDRKHHAKGMCRECYQKQWKQKNREYHTTYMVEWRRKLKVAAITALGGTCKCCGDTTIEFLSIHHINGGGREERQLKHQSGMLRDIRDGVVDLSEYEILCYNCHFALEWWGYCPHKEEYDERAG